MRWAVLSSAETGVDKTSTAPAVLELAVQWGKQTLATNLTSKYIITSGDTFTEGTQTWCHNRAAHGDLV